MHYFIICMHEHVNTFCIGIVSLTSLRSISGEAEHFNLSHPL